VKPTLILPRPTREMLATTPLHRLVQDFPETLSPIRALGLEPESLADLTVESVDEDGALLYELEASTAWRPLPIEA
jgi:hypothetical protein